MSDSSGDRMSLDQRDELPWEEREEAQVSIWRAECEKLSQAHGVKAKRDKLLYRVLTLPATILPVIGTSIVPLLPGRYKEPFNVGLLMTTGILTGVCTFFNFGKRYADHMQYENRYQELVITIDREMVKPKRFRPPCDVFMEATSRQMARLKAAAPDL